MFSNRSNYTLPAPSATQAQSTPKIKYTLHLAESTTDSRHTVINCGELSEVLGSFLFFLFKISSQSDRRGLQLSSTVWIHFEKCLTLKLRAQTSHSSRGEAICSNGSQKVFSCSSFSARCLDKNKELIVLDDQAASEATGCFLFTKILKIFILFLLGVGR